MSHQTGIKSNQELLKKFGKCKSDKTVRAIKISIENEELTFIEKKGAAKSWEADFDKVVKPFIQADVPCYILYRLDEQTPLGYAWMLISWVPETASVRQKMLYASTKATLKTEFGSAHLTEEFHATQLEEVSLEGYRRHKRAFAAPAPLTSREEELEEMRKLEVKTDIAFDTKQQTLGGVNFPCTESCQQALRDMSRGSYTYLQFEINLSEEKIHLVKAANIDTAKLPKEVPDDHARYHLFLFKHTHEGDYQEALLFIYTMPGYTCSVKERMLYSSCKGPFIDTIAAYGLEIVKKIEVDSGDELTAEFLQDEVHPKKILHRPTFAKPKGPANRGPKRLTRPQATE